MRVRKLVLHVGMHKTGTSSIQASFAHNRSVLADHGVRYAGVLENQSGPLYTRFAERPEAYRGNRLYGLERPSFLRLYRRAVEWGLRRDLRRAAGQTLVISGEDIARLGRDELAELKAWFAPHVDAFEVVAFIRPPLSYANSAAQERLRAGTSLERLTHRPPRPFYRNRFEKFVEVFGAEAMNLTVWDPNSFPSGDGVQAFMAKLGLSEGVRRSIPTIRRNESISGPAAELLDAANRIFPVTNDGRPNAQRAFDLADELSREPGPRFTLPPDTLAKLRREVPADVTWLEQTFGLHVAAKDMSLPSDDIPARSPQELTDDLRARIRELNSRLRRREWRQPRHLARRALLAQARL